MPWGHLEINRTLPIQDSRMRGFTDFVQEEDSGIPCMRKATWAIISQRFISNAQSPSTQRPQWTAPVTGTPCGAHPCGAIFMGIQDAKFLESWKPYTQISEECLGYQAVCLLRGQCIKLWEWSWNCTADPRKLENPGMWTIWEKTASSKQKWPKREAIGTSTNSNARGARPPKPLEFTCHCHNLP